MDKLLESCKVTGGDADARISDAGISDLVTGPDFGCTKHEPAEATAGDPGNEATTKTFYMSNGFEDYPVYTLAATKDDQNCNPVEMSEVDAQRIMKAIPEWGWVCGKLAEIDEKE